MNELERTLLYYLLLKCELEPKIVQKISRHIHHAGEVTKNHADLLGLLIDDHTQYLLIDGSRSMTGDLTLTGGAKVTREAWIPASSLRAPGIKPATFVDHGISGAWEFSDGAEEIINANVKIPSDADTSEDMSICIGWSSPAMSLNCDWELAYVLTKVNDDTTAAAQETLQQFATSSATANGLIVTSNTVVAATQIEATDVCYHIQLMRDGNDGADTLGDVAHVHGMVLRYVSNKLGAAI